MRSPLRIPVVLLLAGLAFRAITPAGYMPGSIAEGTPFVLCPNSAPGASYFLQTGTDHAHHHSHHDAPGDGAAEAPWEFCSFGVAFTATAPAPDPSPALDQSKTFVAADAPDVILLPAHSRIFRARGPPVLAS